jgi:mono/diheme cytochrome c family protein
MNGSLKTFKDLLFLEALFCLTAGIVALILPDGLIELLTQSAGNPGEPVGGVVLGRLFGGALIGLGLFHLSVAWSAKRIDAVVCVAATIRAAAGTIRWSVLVGGAVSFQVLGWADLALAVFTFTALLGANTQFDPDTIPNGKVWRRTYLWAFGAVIVLLGWQLYVQAIRVTPAPRLASAEEHFKYGSFGNEKARGIPLYVFEALPDAFPDKLPGGWRSLGFLYEEGRNYPVGFSKSISGFPGISPNCALCHTGAYRTTTDGKQMIVPGAPSELLNFHGFLQFLFAAGKDERFVDGTLLAAIEKRHELGGWEKAFYKYALLPGLAVGLRLGEKDFGWLKLEPTAGPGRLDAGSLLKFNLLRLPYDGLLSTSEIRNVWNQNAGYTNFHRWSGGGKKLQQENTLAAALFLFLQTGLFDAESFDRMTNYFGPLEPPKYPLVLDTDLATAGEKIFRRECAGCHAEDGARIGQITPNTELGVNDAYMKASTKEFLDTLAAIDNPPFTFTGQQESDGYVNSTLEGIWLRAPFLHNGSVPTLRDLLEAPTNRPVTFDRGGDLLDGERVGFTRDEKSPVPAFTFDTRLRGNGNSGHAFGVDLSASDKEALMEYLKTL